jgi:hypothetical protein
VGHILELFAKRETVGDFHVDILFDEVPEDHETPKTKSLSRNEPSRASQTRTILEASRRLLSQAKSADGGVWRTIEDDQKVFIKDGEARGGGPAGPVVGGTPSTKPATKAESEEKPTAKPSDSEPKAEAPKATSDKPKKPTKKVGVVDKSRARAVKLKDADSTAIKSSAKEWESKLTPDEAKAVKQWSGVSYKTIRKQFVKGKMTPQAVAFQAALEKGGNVQVEAYRGLAFTHEASEKFIQQMDAVGVGGTWQDAAPSSATVSSRVAFNYAATGVRKVVVKMKVKTGTYIEGMTRNKAEEEVVIKPNARYRITQLSKGQELQLPEGQKFTPSLYIEMEELD